jgi:hypothetical protein
MSLAAFRQTPKVLSTHAARQGVHDAVRALNVALAAQDDAERVAAERAAQNAATDRRAQEAMHKSRIAREKHEIPVDRRWLEGALNALLHALDEAAADLRKHGASTSAASLARFADGARDELNAKLGPEAK